MYRYIGREQSGRRRVVVGSRVRHIVWPLHQRFGCRTYHRDSCSEIFRIGTVIMTVRAGAVREGVVLPLSLSNSLSLFFFVYVDFDRSSINLP